MSSTTFSAAAPIARRMRAYFAPVNRAAQTPVLFDPTAQGAFNLDAPPSPWLDAGWIRHFTRKSLSQSAPVLTGIPAAPLQQVRTSLQAQVNLQFLSWTKLTMALSTGTQHMNVLAAAGGAAPVATGAPAIPAVSIQAGSTSTSVVLSSAANFAPGQTIAVDADYTGQTGYLGSPIAGAYLTQALADIDYLRRITFNLAQIAQITGSVLTLAQPLPAGAPTSNLKLQTVTGFVDREGGSFYPEWSALFVAEGTQGERIFFHYPRLQPMMPAAESALSLAETKSSKLQQILLDAQFLALPVTDPLDGERILCYRSFIPAS